jgi:hypothetical protein
MDMKDSYAHKGKSMESLSASSFSPMRASFFVSFVSSSESTLIQSFSVALNDESTSSLHR